MVVVVVVAAQPCRIVTAMIAASTANEKVVVSRLVNSAIAGLKEEKTATRRSALSPIQTLLLASSFEKNLASLSSQFAASSNRRFKFEKSRQLFIGVHSETPSVVTK